MTKGTAKGTNVLSGQCSWLGLAGQGFDMDDPAYVERVLKARARRLAAPRLIEGEAHSSGMAVLCFSLVHEIFALPLNELCEVAPLSAWTPVPGQPQHLLGVTNLRGEIRPVLNLHTLLTLPEPDTSAPGHVVYVRSQGREVGLRVETLRHIRFIETAKLTVPHQSANGLPQRFIAGISPDTLILLDTKQILALDVLQDARAGYRSVT